MPEKKSNLASRKASIETKAGDATASKTEESNVDARSSEPSRTTKARKQVPEPSEKRQSTIEKLRQARSALQEELKELKRTVQETVKQNDRLITENSRLSQQLAEVSQNTTLLARLESITGELEATRLERDTLKAELATASASMAETLQVRSELEKRIGMLTRQLSQKDILPLLTAEEAADVLDRFVGELCGQHRQFELIDGEFRLKAGIASDGVSSGFVLPGSTAPPEIRDALQEIVVRFVAGDRTGE